MTHLCVGKITIIGSAIIWTNDEVLLDEEMKFCRYSHIFIQVNAFEYVVCKIAAILSRPQYDKASNKERDVMEFYRGV